MDDGEGEGVRVRVRVREKREEEAAAEGWRDGLGGEGGREIHEEHDGKWGYRR